MAEAEERLESVRHGGIFVRVQLGGAPCISRLLEMLTKFHFSRFIRRPAVQNGECQGRTLVIAKFPPVHMPPGDIEKSPFAAASDVAAFACSDSWVAPFTKFSVS